ncbi:MAG: GNAT family N-acetyltransferase [Desulfocucumaceae bacterium]
MYTDTYTFETPKGQVHIEGAVSGAYIDSLRMNSNLKNFRPPDKQKEALIKITDLPNGMIYIARHQDEIIGYITFHHADEYTRWSRHPKVLEMGGIEISPDWRRCSVGDNLMRVAYSEKKLEDFIVITMEYCWHWDLRSSNLDVWAYQKMLTKLFGRVGLNKITTDDPDIIEHPANVLMVSFGKKVPKEDILRFEAMRFLGKLGAEMDLM